MMASPDPPPWWRCAECGRDRFAPSILDERYCMPFAVKRYAWRRISIGRIRLVPPKEAALWEVQP